MSPPNQENPNINYFNHLNKRKLQRRRIKKFIGRPFGWLRRLLLRPVASLLTSRGLLLFVVSNPHRIGHLISEPDWILKQIVLGERAPANKIMLLQPGHKKSANKAVLDLWRPHMDIVTSKWFYRCLNLFRDFPDLTIYGADGILPTEGATDYSRVLAKWGDRDPLVKLTEQDIDIGQQTLADLGVPQDAWFVCLHVREGGYSPKDDFIHAYRNASVDTYAAAAREIAARGGWTIRMGDPTMTPLALEGANAKTWPNTIDYACSKLKSESADLFFCSTAKFFLGTVSGLTNVASTFGVPSVLVNMIPHSDALGYGPEDIAITKLLARADGKLIPFAEIFQTEIGLYRAADLFKAANLTIIDNSAEEISETIVEMLNRLDGMLDPPTTRDTKLYECFRSLIGAEHLCYHSEGSVGRAFLRRHQNLL
mgnify:CR=1 FL=1